LNLFVGFRTVFEADCQKTVSLHVTGSTLYRIRLNGRFIGHGPARAAHGFYRVDEWPLTPLRTGTNVVSIEVAGYNVSGYAYLNQPSFLQAEIRCGDRVLAATGARQSGFTAHLLKERVQKVPRYSFQRPFSEAYRCTPASAAWLTDPATPLEALPCSLQKPRQVLPRGVPLPRFECRQPTHRLSRGTVARQPLPENVWRDRSLTETKVFGGYPLNRLDWCVSDEAQTYRCDVTGTAVSTFDPGESLSLAGDTWQDLDFGRERSGFIGVHVTCREPVRIFLFFDEILSGGDLDWKRMGTLNAIPFDLVPGDYDLETFEPYSLRYLRILALDGAVEIRAPYLRELACPSVWESAFACSDPKLNELFDAARDTFRQNAVDLFMDCPSRERAGWLCDSFFTARVERDLCGANPIERNFLENFLLPPAFPGIPDGMLPMCYPSDHPNHQYIPNWALWFVLQLEEYAQRTGDRALVDALKPRVMALFDFFKRYRNSDGLLEKLESWVFIEWSKANEFTQDVNYPSNMLYAGALDAAGRLYNEPGFADEALRLRHKIRQQSFDGRYFVDNAVRQEGRLVVTQNHTETCQYYAFFFGLALPDTHPELWRTLLQDYDPCRPAGERPTALHPANAFIGYYLRLELLSRFGARTQIQEELKALFLPMARITGTLWENMGAYASCNHGFASHVVHSLYRDVAGCRVDWPTKTVHLHLDAGQPLNWCSSRIPTGNGTALAVDWWHDPQGHLQYRTELPAGFTLVTTHANGALKPETT
jgi:alpha-L-rhamnosidase